MLATFLSSLVLCATILGTLLASGLAWRIATDVPNSRSLHTRPIPRIGGWGLIPAAIATAFLFDAANLPLAGLAMALFAVSYLDDRLGLPFSARFTVHAFASILWVAFGPASLPLLLAGNAAFAIMWWSNLYNFMDGANGLAGGMGIIGFAAYAIAAASFGMMPLAIWSAALAGASAGFLLFNFHLPRVFLGDSGSIPLGFLVGALGLWGWSGDAWPAWFPLLVFGPFFFDATVTLMTRMIRGEKFWSAHLEHYYQRVIRMGWSHQRTATFEYLLMSASAALAIAMLDWKTSAQYAGLAAAMAVFAGIAIIVDRRWNEFTTHSPAAWRHLLKLSSPFVLATFLVWLGTTIVTLQQDAPRYPYVVLEVPGGLRATFLHQSRPKKSLCEEDVTRIVNAIRSKCPTCQFIEQTCLDNLEIDQSRMLSAAPLDIPSARLPDGIVTFKSSSPVVALAACRESERQAPKGPRGSIVQCRPPGQL